MSAINNIKAILILDLTGKRILGKYYDEYKQRNTDKFERQLFLKTRSTKTKDEVFVLDSSLIVHRYCSNHHIYVVGAREENPLVLDKALNCLVVAINTLIDRNIDANTLQANLDQIILALDEICDQGILLETDPNLVLDRVCLESGVAEQSLAQVLQSAAEMRFPWISS